MIKKFLQSLSEKEKKESLWLNPRANTFLFYLLVLIIPIQLGYHFWPESAFIKGVRVDYLSPTLYLTDTLIVFALLYGFFSNIAEQKGKSIKIKLERINQKLWVTLIIFLFFLFLNFTVSINKESFIYGLFKLTEWTLLFLFIATLKEIKIKSLIKIMSLSLITVSIITLLQFVNQSSIGGFLYFLGERTFRESTPGIANASLNGTLYLRPYATFPHPNVLAGFILIYSAIIFSKLKTKSINLEFLAVALGTSTILLTMSRVSIVLFVFMLVYYGRQKFNRKTLSLFGTIIVGLLILTPLRDRFLLSDQDIQLRSELGRIAWELISANPLTGVGISNFLNRMSEFPSISTSLFIQPVHNIYLLVATEWGLLILFTSIYFLLHSLRRAYLHKYLKDGLLLSLIGILIIGFFDHYFITLQQGQLLLVLVLGLIWSKTHFVS